MHLNYNSMSFDQGMQITYRRFGKIGTSLSIDGRTGEEFLIAELSSPKKIVHNHYSYICMLHIEDRI